MGIIVFKLVNYKPFGIDNEPIYPEWHIEQLVNKETPYTELKFAYYKNKVLSDDPSEQPRGEIIDNKVEWSFPQDYLKLLAHEEKAPQYLKLFDGYNSYYFIRQHIEGTIANKNGFIYRYHYSLDKYMTRYGTKFQYLKSVNPTVHHINSFTDRLGWWYDFNNIPNDYEIELPNQNWGTYDAGPYIRDNFNLTDKEKDKVIYEMGTPSVGSGGFLKVYGTDGLVVDGDVKRYGVYGVKEINPVEKDNPKINAVPIYGALLDFFKEKQFGNTVKDGNYQKIKNEIYQLTPTRFFDNNFPNIDKNSVVVATNGSATGNTGAYTEYLKPNKNGRFIYLVAKGSSVINPVDPTLADKKLLIPLISGREEATINALMNTDITAVNNTRLNPLSTANTIGVFETNEPFAMGAGQATIDSNVKVSFRVNTPTVGGVVGMPFFVVPINYAPKGKIIDYTDYKKGFDGRINYLFHNAHSTVDHNTEPTLLNPVYYTEELMIDTDKTVSTDLSLFFYGLRNISEEATGLSLFGYFIYDDKAQLVYDYGEYTNKLNPIWNNSYSMLRGQVSLNTPALSSAMANYYQTNVATQYTNAVNIKAQQANDWQNVAFNRADDAFNVLRTATKTISPNPFDWVKAGANTKIDIANTITNAMRDDINTRYQHEMQNRNYQANINNIKSSPSTALTTPSLLACIPQTAGGKIFSTDLHDGDKDTLLTRVLNQGYPINSVGSLNNYDNRQIMNVLGIDTTYNRSYLLSLLNKLSGIGDTNYYNYEFLDGLGGIKQMFKTDILVNCTSVGNSDYIPNIENILPPTPIDKININSYFELGTNIGTYYFYYEISDFDVFKPNIEAKAIKPLPSDFGDNVDYVIDVSLSAITLKAKGNSSYYGVVVLYYTQPYIKTPQGVVLHNDSGEVVGQDTQNFTRISDTEGHQKVIETHGAKGEVNKEIDFGLLCGDTTNDSRANVLGTTLNNDLVYPVNIFRELYVNPTTTISSVSNEYSKLNAITISNSGVGLYHIDYETYGNTSFYNKFTTINITNNGDPFTAPKDELRINELRYTMPPMTTSPTTALTLYIRNHFTTNDNPVINLNKINLLFNKATVVRQCNLTGYIRLELRKNTTKHIYTPLFNTAIGSMSYGTYVIQFIIEDLDTPHIPNTKEVHGHLKVPTTHITLNQGIVLSALQNQMKLHIHLPTGTDIRMFYNKTPTLLEVVYIYDYN